MIPIDPSSFDGWAAIHIAVIAYLIGAFTLLGYVKGKRFTSLLLSASFFLLVIPPLCSALGSSWNVILFDWVIVELINILAFVLLVLAYLLEIRKQRIGLHWSIKGVIVASFILPLIYSVYKYVDAPFDLFAYFGLGPLVHYVLIYLSLGLMGAVAALMFSFYRIKGNRNLIIGMAGSLMILSGWAVAAILIEPGAMDAFQQLTEGWGNLIISVAVFAGYVVFLVAVHRTRLVRG